MIRLIPSPKAYSADQDKSVSPRDTLEHVKQRLDSLPLSIVAETRRIDNGRLDIPVFLSICGPDAQSVMPTRKQMGKGASPEQAEASALMELMERYGFFTFWERLPGALRLPWSEAEHRLGEQLMPLEEIIAACHDSISTEEARRIMNCRLWLFVPATRILDGKEIYVPLDLFKQLGEFNGSSAGNTDVESILQGACELVERHVSCLLEREKLALPTISLTEESLDDPVLIRLVAQFTKNGIELLLKDASLGMPVPTVAALAHDPATFPASSEIIFTAGTASSPAKAAIRAITEVAQLAGDFNSNACYEASGLPKYDHLSETEWLRAGPAVPLHALSSVEDQDQLTELRSLSQQLHDAGYALYSVPTTDPDTGVPSHYSFIPGFHFRERDINASLGLFTGRLVSEEADEETAEHVFSVLADIYPEAHFLPFFRGMTSLRHGNIDESVCYFAQALRVQPDPEARALTAFYQAYALTLRQEYREAIPLLRHSVALCPQMKEYRNLHGVCLFKEQLYGDAASEFEAIVSRLDKGSALDWLNLGMCRKHLGEHSEATRCLIAALCIDPSLDKARDALQEIGHAES